MKKTILAHVFFFLCEAYLLSQIQMGSTLIGEQASDFFGTRVVTSADGLILAASSPWHSANNGNQVGQVKVFFWNSFEWTLIDTPLVGSDNVSENFGRALAISHDGQILAVGSPDYANNYGFSAGKVQVFSLSGNTWTNMGGQIEGDNDNIKLGHSVALSAQGNTLAIGIPWYNPNFITKAGQVRIYNWDGSNWQQTATLNGNDFSEELGYTLALSADGDILAIGSPFAHNFTGGVKVFQLENGTWQQLGEDIEGMTTGTFFGQSIALSHDGETLAIGAPKDNNNGISAGQVQVYQWNGNQWEQKGNTMEGSPSSQFGYSLSLSADGNTITVGAPYYTGSSGEEAGRIHIFRWNGNNWQEQINNDISGTSPFESAGSAVALSANADIIAIGAPGAYNTVGVNSGNVRAFQVCSPHTSSITASACQSFTSSQGNIYTSSGTYEEILPNVSGCGDSIITLNLTIIPVETNISWDGTSFSAEAFPATYQWINCENNIPIAGQTQQSFTPSESGSYAVVITQSSCTDTSDCQEVILTRASDFPRQKQWVIFPNPMPAAHPLYIRFNEPHRQVQILLYDALGQIRLTQSFLDTQTIQLQCSLPQGIYFLHGKADGTSLGVYKILIY